MRFRLRGGPHDGREIDLDPPLPPWLTWVGDGFDDIYGATWHGQERHYEYEGRLHDGRHIR